TCSAALRRGGPFVAVRTARRGVNRRGAVTMKCQANTLPIVVMMVALAPTALVLAKEALLIRVSPAISFAPANLAVRTSIEPDASYRALEIIADSDQFYRPSVFQLDGERAPKISIFEFHSLPPGEYERKAALIGVDGQARTLARAHVNGVESGASR